MKSSLRVAVCAAVVSAAAISACGGDDAGDTTSSPAPAPAASDSQPEPAADIEMVKVGLVLEQSGPLAPDGASALELLERAAGDINETGFEVAGERYGIELVVRDNKTDPSASVAAATELVEDEGVQFIFGPTTSASATGVAQVVLPQGVLMLSPAFGLQELLTPEAIEGDSSTLFRTNFSPTSLGDVYAQGFSYGFPDAETVAVVTADDPSGAQTSGAFRAAAESLGLEIVADETYPADATDYQTVLTNVAADAPDVIFICCTSAQLTGLARQIEELGVEAGLFYSNQPLSIVLEDAVGEPIQNRAAVPYQPVLMERLPDGSVFTNRPGMDELAADIGADSGPEFDVPRPTAFYYYDFLALLTAAMTEAGTVEDTSAIAAELAGGVTVEGAVGEVAFSANHVSTVAPDLCAVENGEVTCGVGDSPAS